MRDPAAWIEDLQRFHPYTCAMCTDAPRPEWETVDGFLDHMRATHPDEFRGMDKEPNEPS